MIATAHRLARTIYFMLKHKVPYQDPEAEQYEAQRQQRELSALNRRAAKLGFDLTAKEPAASPS